MEPIYKMALKSYIESSDYRIKKEHFFWIYRHTGMCVDAAYTSAEVAKGVRIPYEPCVFESEIYLRNKALNQKRHGEYLYILGRMSDRELRKLFSNYFKCKSGNYLFAVCFAYASGLTQKQIAQISNIRKWRSCWKRLNYFLMNPGQQTYSPGTPELRSKYCVEVNGKKQIGFREKFKGEKIKLVSGKVFCIV